ncbi:hypothetical protein S7335_3130 [Synechococcus sp. PCC 7335]|nr:hypothetical protein S7335_3130 [Synechococcus sp. PCC 7335]
MHEDTEKRYVAAIAVGVFYIIVGIFSATVSLFFRRCSGSWWLRSQV